MSTDFEQYFPSKSIDVHEENLAEFFMTMYIRQEIWYDRNMLKLPRKQWNKSDEILSKYKFCNAYRELDKTSQWIIHNIILNGELKLIDKVWKICIARLFNNIDFLNIVDIPNIDEYTTESFYYVVECYEEYRSSTNKKAYAINSWLAKGTTQGLACAKYIIPSLHKHISEIFFIGFVGNNTWKELIRKITMVEGIGKFVSHEWFIDMCYVSKYSAEQFNFNENTWTNIGPGAQLGLRLIMPSRPQNLETLRDIQELSKSLLPEDFKYIQWDEQQWNYKLCDWNITLTNIEFWLCEFQKYWKIKNGIGKSRDLYSMRQKQL